MNHCDKRFKRTLKNRKTGKICLSDQNLNFRLYLGVEWRKKYFLCRLNPTSTWQESADEIILNSQRKFEKNFSSKISKFLHFSSCRHYELVTMSIRFKLVETRRGQKCSKWKKFVKIWWRLIPYNFFRIFEKLIFSKINIGLEFANFVILKFSRCVLIFSMERSFSKSNIFESKMNFWTWEGYSTAIIMRWQ